MKFLVEEATGRLKGSFEPPLSFSVSGHYVVDVPTFLGVVPPSDSSADLVEAKVSAFKSVYPSLRLSENSEFLSASDVDESLSSGFSVGPNKRTYLEPGGSIQTPQIVVQGDSPAGQLFFHFSVFTLALDPGSSPARLMYNWSPSGFFDPDVSDVAVSLMDSDGGSEIQPLTPGAVNPFSYDPGFTFRLMFANVGTSRLWLSDWIVLYGGL